VVQVLSPSGYLLSPSGYLLSPRWGEELSPELSLLVEAG